MHRPLIALTLTATVISAQEPEAEPLYYPTKTGDRRTYEQIIGNAKSEAVETVTKVEPKGKGFLVSVTREAGMVKNAPIVMEVSEKGVYRLSRGDKAEKMPIPLLKLPAKVGDIWVVEMDGLAAPTKSTNRVLPAEQVEVPAGKFKAIPIETIFSQADGKSQKNIAWHAPGIGIVKIAGSFGETEVTLVLKSFTPGK